MATDSKGNTALIWAAYQGQDKLQKMDRQIQFRKFLDSHINLICSDNQSFKVCMKKQNVKTDLTKFLNKLELN